MRTPPVPKSLLYNLEAYFKTLHAVFRMSDLVQPKAFLMLEKLMLGIHCAY